MNTDTETDVAAIYSIPSALRKAVRVRCIQRLEAVLSTAERDIDRERHRQTDGQTDRQRHHCNMEGLNPTSFI